MKVLAIDDEKDFLSMLKTHLEEAEGFDVCTSIDGKDILALMKKAAPDLILLDLNLKDTYGLEICKILKEHDVYSNIPIIIISGQTEEADKISGLNLGADDYMVKPISIKELRARIRAIARRLGLDDSDKIGIGDGLVEIDPKEHRVFLKGSEIELTKAEFDILKLLASRKGHVFSRSSILEYLWGEEKCVVEQTVDVHIKHLRDKLGKGASFIQNIRGVGYKLEDIEE